MIGCYDCIKVSTEEAKVAGSRLIKEIDVVGTSVRRKKGRLVCRCCFEMIVRRFSTAVIRDLVIDSRNFYRGYVVPTRPKLRGAHGGNDSFAQNSF